MTPQLTLGLLVGCTICGRGFGQPVAPAPQEKIVLKCEMHWTGKVETTVAGDLITGDVPGSADVAITNISCADVDIGSKSGPYAHLDLRVKDPTGAIVKTEPLSSLLSTQSLLKPKQYILKPGEVYRCKVDLLGQVPVEKRIAGTYKVKALYTIGNKEYGSAEVEIQWPWKKK